MNDLPKYDTMPEFFLSSSRFFLLLLFTGLTTIEITR